MQRAGLEPTMGILQVISPISSSLSSYDCIDGQFAYTYARASVRMVHMENARVFVELDISICFVCGTPVAELVVTRQPPHVTPAAVYVIAACPIRGAGSGGNADGPSARHKRFLSNSVVSCLPTGYQSSDQVGTTMAAPQNSVVCGTTIEEAVVANHPSHVVRAAECATAECPICREASGVNADIASAKCRRLC
jgi:hypothetical protein